MDTTDRIPLREHTKVRRLAQALGVSPAHAVGLLHEAADWFRLRGPGRGVGGAVPTDLDASVGHNGLAEALMLVGWLEAGTAGLSLSPEAAELARRGWSHAPEELSRRHTRCSPPGPGETTEGWLVRMVLCLLQHKGVALFDPRDAAAIAGHPRASLLQLAWAVDRLRRATASGRAARNPAGFVRSLLLEKTPDAEHARSRGREVAAGLRAVSRGEHAAVRGLFDTRLFPESALTSWFGRPAGEGGGGGVESLGAARGTGGDTATHSTTGFGRGGEGSGTGRGAKR